MCTKVLNYLLVYYRRVLSAELSYDFKINNDGFKKKMIINTNNRNKEA